MVATPASLAAHRVLHSMNLRCWFEARPPALRAQVFEGSDPFLVQSGIVFWTKNPPDWVKNWVKLQLGKDGRKNKSLQVISLQGLM